MKERTGWRDEEISALHRKWGYDCPAVDIDFLLIEFDRFVVKAIVEYKNEHAEMQSKDKPQYKAIRNLADRAEVPFFSVRYSDDYSSWTVASINNLAEEYIKPIDKKWPVFTQVQYVDFLYKLRGSEIPSYIKEDIENETV